MSLTEPVINGPTLVHRPLPLSVLLDLPARTVVNRVGRLVGVQGRLLPLPGHDLTWSDGGALARVGIELLLTRLTLLYPTCNTCARADCAPECARELGVLEGWLTNISSRWRVAALGHSDYPWQA